MRFEEEIQNFFAEIGIGKTMVLSTSFRDMVTARTVSVVVDDGKFYFITDKTFRKCQQIRNNPNVALCFEHISVEGICKEMGPPMNHPWFEILYKEQYPKAYELYFSLSNERLFQIEPAFIQLWLYEDEKPYIAYFDIEKKIYRKILYTGEPENNKEALMKKLLTIGGSKVLMPETVSEDIYNFGHLYNYRVLVPVGGTSRYFLNHEDEVRVLWGFVLDEEGIWEMHSWLIDQSHQVIIDNRVYEKYFGFIK